MPELPEVETVMRGLAARLDGRRIVRAEVRRPDLRWAFPPGLAARLRGARVLGFRRRAKYMLMRLEGGDSALIHLGMSGRMLIRAHGANEPVAHEHVELETEDGWTIGFVDPRRFGSVDLVPTADEDSHRLLSGLGPEPLEAEFSAAALRRAVAGKRVAIKAALLDQRVVAGLGNIYVCEALYRAGLSPTMPAGELAGALSRRAPRLVREIKATLTEAIAAGGSSLRDYVQPSGELGYFQHAWAVYGREGERCAACPGPPRCDGIRRAVQGGRSTFFCPRRQGFNHGRSADG
jgi:formamidopyrimidine-DNA glycosylase